MRARLVGDVEEHRKDFVGGEVVLVVAVLIVVEDEGRGVGVEELGHDRLAQRGRLARVALPVVALVADRRHHRRGLKREVAPRR